MYSKILAIVGFLFLLALAYLYFQVQVLKEKRGSSPAPMEAASTLVLPKPLVVVASTFVPL